MLDSEPKMSNSDSSSLASVAVSADQFAQIMSAISEWHLRLDAKLAEFRAEIRQGQEDAAAKALKRVWFDKPYVFKTRSNKEQASFRAKVDEALVQAESDRAPVAVGPASTPAVQWVKDGFKRGQSLIDEGQKLNRLADRSEHGRGGGG